MVNASLPTMGAAKVVLGIGGIVGFVLACAGIKAGLGLFGFVMLAEGVYGVRTRRISFRHRGRRDSYQGTDAVIMGVTLVLVGLGLVAWACYSSVLPSPTQ